MKKLFILLSLFFVTNVFAANNYVAKYDNFNVTDANHVKVKPGLLIKDAEMKITGGDKDYFKIGDYYNYGSKVYKALYYEGPLEFGTGIGDLAHVNTKDATIKLRWNDGVVLYDGTSADLVVTLSNITFVVAKKSESSDESPDGKYNMPIMLGTYGLWFQAGNPKIKMRTDKDTAWDELDADGKAKLTAALSANKFKVNVKVVKSGTDTPIDSKYKNMAFGAYDLDYADRLVNVSNITDETEQYVARYNGPYTEGIEILGGLLSDIHLATNNPTENKREQSLLKVVEGTNGANSSKSWRIFGDSTKFTDTTIRNTPEDPETYYSGFMAMVAPQGFDFYWTGSYGCGTSILVSQDVVVDQTHNKGGNVTTVSYGQTKKLDNEESVQHEIGSKPIYNYAPSTGYHVVSLKVNGKEEKISSDYKYQFDTLVYNPLVRLTEDGEIAKDENGKVIRALNAYSIDVVYAPNSFTIVYENGGGTDGEKSMPNGSGKFGENTVLSENKFKKNDYKFGGWKVYTEDASGKRTEVLVNGKALIVGDKGTIKDVAVPENGKLVVVAQWVQNPKTGVTSYILPLIGVAGIATVIYTSLKKKNYFSKI